MVFPIPRTKIRCSSSQYTWHNQKKWQYFANNLEDKRAERQAYSFSYDFLNRMTATRYDNLNDAGTATNNTNARNESLTYDIRGNINTLIRTGKFKSPVTATCWTDGQIDNLTYTYNANTNRLQKVADTAPAASKVQGWDNMAGAASGSQFGYDANGNMTSDPYKGMTVAYNFMNLPTRFTFTGNKVIDIIYDGSGRKLRKTVTNNSIVQYTQDYLSGIEYRTNSSATLSLESIYHGEGRVFNTNTGTINADALRYEYSIRDHLGNTRLMFTDKNADGKIDITTTASTEVLQENHYYPFGMNMSGPWQDDAARNTPYQYNGKELNEDFGLGLSDYGARWYDAGLGRWWSGDPVADKFAEWSIYHYVMGNPVILADPDGRDTIVANRSSLNETLSDDRTHVYDLTYSKISNEEESVIDDPSLPRYMFTNAYYDTEGNDNANPLSKPVYTLQFDQMSKYNGTPGWENTIRVYMGIFVHPAEEADMWLKSCQSVCSSFESKDNGKFFGSNKSETRRALQSIRDWYDSNASTLTGDKFLLTTNRTVEVEESYKLKTSDKFPSMTTEPAGQN